MIIALVEDMFLTLTDACSDPARIAAARNDLGAVIKLMEDLENDLADSEETLARHGLKIQNMDIAMQMLRAVAAELESRGGECVIGASLKDLRVACSEVLGHS